MPLISEDELKELRGLKAAVDAKKEKRRVFVMANYWNRYKSSFQYRRLRLRREFWEEHGAPLEMAESLAGCPLRISSRGRREQVKFREGQNLPYPDQVGVLLGFLEAGNLPAVEVYLKATVRGT